MCDTIVEEIKQDETGRPQAGVGLKINEIKQDETLGQSGVGLKYDADLKMIWLGVHNGQGEASLPLSLAEAMQVYENLAKAILEAQLIIEKENKEQSENG